MLNLGLLSSGTVLAGQDKMDVCHLEGNGTYQLISIAEPAYQTHFDHGDWKVGDPVHDDPGYVFDDYCGTVEAVVECPCMSSEDTSNFPVFFEGLIGKCITDNSPDSFFIKNSTDDFVFMDEGSCGYLGSEGYEVLDNLSEDEGVACIDLLVDVVANTEGLPEC